MSIYSWGFDRVEQVPPEKEAVSARIREMQAANWKELEDMTDAELDAFEREVDDARMVLDFDHPHAVAMSAAYKAIKHERARRFLQGQNARREQHNRAMMIHEAAELVRQAVEKIDMAYTIEPQAWYFQMCEVPALDVATAEDGELENAGRVCVGIVNEKPDTYAEDAAVIGVLKGKSVRAISSELSERGKARAERLEKARSLLAEITAEQARRERERRELEERTSLEGMEKRIAALEGKLADKQEPATPPC